MIKKYQSLLMILVLFFTTSILSSSPKHKSKVRFFAPNSLYIYVMGSYTYFLPPTEHFLSLGSEGANAFAPVFGLGYRILNIRDKFFVSFEGDYSPASYNFDYFSRDQKISILTFMLNMEGYISGRIPMILFGGIGIGSHHLTDLEFENYQGDMVAIGDDNLTVLALDIGIKIPISGKFLIRSEFQWNGKIYSDYVYDEEYWVDEWIDNEWEFLSSTFSVGIEFHF